MNVGLVHVGFKNYVETSKIIAIAKPNSSPIKRSIQEARAKEIVIDLTSGKKTKSVVFTDSGHIVLVAVDSPTIIKRVAERANR